MLHLLVLLKRRELTVLNPGKSLITKGWFDGCYLPPGIVRCQQVYILKNLVILGKYLTVLKNFGEKNSKKKKKTKKKHLF